MRSIRSYNYTFLNKSSTCTYLVILTNKDTMMSLETQVPDNLSNKKTYRAWLLLCYSTGPVASMTRTYVPAAIQSVAYSIGKSAAGEKCSLKGKDCYVKFGVSKVHATSYVLYLKAISTAVEGVTAMCFMGIADYSNYRKSFLCGSILIYGALALPFAGLSDKSYSVMTGLAVLYSLLNIVDCVFQITEGSYIPLFMRAAASVEESEEGAKRALFNRGSTVSVMGLFVGNCGSITALLIGMVISYTKGGTIENGYQNFLLAITIAGCLTVFFAAISCFFIPNIHGKPKPKDRALITLTVSRMIGSLRTIREYPQAFLYCISWVIWNVSYSSFLSVFMLLFRTTLGIGSSDAEYTVYTCMSYIVSCLGPLAWMALYPRLKLHIKSWGYAFLFVQAFTNFWGTIGINGKEKIGFKHRWEFWVFEVLFNGTGSAMRSLNRTVYSTMLPEGDEAQYFGLEVMLGISTGWIANLVNATIQDRTGNERFPFLPNFLLMLVSVILYFMCDFERGMEDASRFRQSSREGSDTSTTSSTIL